MLNKLTPKSEFSRNVLTLMTGTTIAQAIPIAISPILTRIYTPEDFGVLTLFVAISSIFGSIANARYELAIMLPKKDEDAINIFALGFIITVLISLILLFLVVLFHDYFMEVLNNEEIGVWLYFIPVSVLFTGIYNILNYFNNRKKYYKDIANTTIIRSMTTAVIQLSIGFFKGGVSGLISGQLVSHMFANMRLFKNIIIKDELFMSKISKVKMIALARRYKDFPKHNAPAALFDITALQLPYLFLIKIYNNAILGFYFMAVRIVFLPSSLISNSIGQVFFQSMSDKKNKKEKCMPLLFQTTKKLAIIALVIAVLIFVLSPIMFPIIFGQEWLMSGEIAKYLSIVFFVRFVVSPVSSVFSVSGFIKKGAFWKYLYFSTSLIMFLYVLMFKIEFYDFLLLYVIHEVILYSLYYYLIVQAAKQLDDKTKGVI